MRAELDTRTDLSFGRRVVDWELKGVPVRVEVGPRDLASGVVTLVRRDSGAKDTVPVAEAAPRVLSLLEHIQGELLAEATEPARGSHHRGRHRRGGRRSGGGRVRSPAVVRGRGRRARTGMRATASPCAACGARTARCPSTTPNRASLATVGRAY